MDIRPQTVLGAHLPWVLMDPQSLDEGAGLDTQFSAAQLAASSVFPDQRTKVTEPWEFLLGPELAAQAAPETGAWALQLPRPARRLGTPKSIDDIPDALFIVIAADGGLSLRDFGRLACVASRLWARSVVNHTAHRQRIPGHCRCIHAHFLYRAER